MTHARVMLAVAAAALLAGCEQHPARYNDTSEWHPNGANAANLAAMAADPLDLVRGHGDPGSDGAEAAGAVRRLRSGQVTPVAASITGNGGAAGAGPNAGMGAGMGAVTGAAAAGGSTTGD